MLNMRMIVTMALGSLLLGCGAKFEIQREFTSSIEDKSAVVAELAAPEGAAAAASGDTMDPQMQLCIEMSEFSINKTAGYLEQFVTELDKCYDLGGATLPEDAIPSVDKKLMEENCEKNVLPVFKDCTATVDELELCFGTAVELGAVLALEGLAYGCDSVDVPARPELHEACDAVMKKCPGMLEFEEYEESEEYSVDPETEEIFNLGSDQGDEGFPGIGELEDSDDDWGMDGDEDDEEEDWGDDW